MWYSKLSSINVKFTLELWFLNTWGRSKLLLHFIWSKLLSCLWFFHCHTFKQRWMCWLKSRFLLILELYKSLLYKEDLIWLYFFQLGRHKHKTNLFLPLKEMPMEISQFAPILYVHSNNFEISMQSHTNHRKCCNCFLMTFLYPRQVAGDFCTPL